MNNFYHVDTFFNVSEELETMTKKELMGLHKSKSLNLLATIDSSKEALISRINQHCYKNEIKDIKGFLKPTTRLDLSKRDKCYKTGKFYIVEETMGDKKHSIMYYNIV